jgi:hypothetical protein
MTTKSTPERAVVKAAMRFHKRWGEYYLRDKWGASVRDPVSVRLCRACAALTRSQRKAGRK